MYYIDGPGATADNKFTEGDPAAGVAATTVTDDFMNDVQMEILNVMFAAGLVPAKNTPTQLLQALRGLGPNGIFTTPPQFDNSKKGATTEFVQRALGSYSGYISPPNLTVGDVSWAGKVVHANAGALTLPPAGAFPIGACIHVKNTGAGALTLNANGADRISVNGGTLGTYSLGIGDEISAFAGSDTWLMSGSATLKDTGGFQAVLGANGSGWAMHPSGLLTQWGTTPVLTVAADVTIPLPKTFPTQVYAVLVSSGYSPGSNSPAWGAAALSGAGQITARAGIGSNTFMYIALGR